MAYSSRSDSVRGADCLGGDGSLDVDAGGCGGRSGGCAGAGTAVCLEVVVGDTELGRVCVLCKYVVVQPSHHICIHWYCPVPSTINSMP
jgi:hypothetical protein